MKAIDRFLERNGVDVGKAFGLLSIIGAIHAFYRMLGQLFAGRVFLDFTVPIAVVVGVALWQHRSWSRTLVLVISWAAVVLLSAILLAIPFTGTANLTLNMGTAVIKHPPLWQAYTFAVFLTPIAWFTLSVLHSERAKSEFKKLNQIPEPTSGLTPRHGS